MGFQRMPQDKKMNGFRTVKFDGMRIESSAGRMRSEESSALFYDPIRLKSHTLGSRERARGETKKSLNRATVRRYLV